MSARQGGDSRDGRGAQQRAATLQWRLGACVVSCAGGVGGGVAGKARPGQDSAGRGAYPYSPASAPARLPPAGRRRDSRCAHAEHCADEGSRLTLFCRTFFGCHVIRASLPPQTCLAVFAGSRSLCPCAPTCSQSEAARAHHSLLGLHHLRSRSLAAIKIAVWLLWCSLLFAVGAQSTRAEPSANPRPPCARPRALLRCPATPVGATHRST